MTKLTITILYMGNSSDIPKDVEIESTLGHMILMDDYGDEYSGWGLTVTAQPLTFVEWLGLTPIVWVLIDKDDQGELFQRFTIKQVLQLAA